MASQVDAVTAALTSFLEAFAAGDTNAMRDALADHATAFPRTPSGRSGALADSRRTIGIDPEMLDAIDAARRGGSKPPYLSIDPQDLDVVVSGDMALATFHLITATELGRRTFVLRREDNAWKILHTHASNAVGTQTAD